MHNYGVRNARMVANFCRRCLSAKFCGLSVEVQFILKVVGLAYYFSKVFCWGVL